MEYSPEDLMRIMDGMDALSTNVDRTELVRSPFSYPGGKSRSVEHLLRFIPQEEYYCEVCSGASNLLLARPPAKLEILNDRHAGVTSFFRCLRSKEMMSEVVRLLELTPHSREEFYEFKKVWEREETDVLRAFKWYYTINYSFGSLADAFGRSVTLYNQLGAKLKENIQGFEAVRQRIMKSPTIVENLDIHVCLNDYDNFKQVFYIDPPYDSKESADCYMHKVNHPKLLEHVFQLKGFVAISGYENELYSKYDWDDIKTWEVFGSSATQEHKPLDSRRDSITEYLYIKEFS